MKWTKDCGKPPCDGCFDDWCDYQDWEGYIGTMQVPACGDGCCHERVECYWCHGTGIEQEEE